MSIKENWLKEDEVCPYCGQVTKRVRGLTKQNLKRLLIPKWNATEITITIMLILVLLLAWAYNYETKACKEWLKPLAEGSYDDCVLICDSKCRMFHANDPINTNFTNFTNESKK